MLLALLVAFDVVVVARAVSTLVVNICKNWLFASNMSLLKYEACFWGRCCPCLGLIGLANYDML